MSIGPCLCGDPFCGSCFPGGQSEPDFEDKFYDVIEDLQSMFQEKTKQYGSSAFDENVDFPTFKWWMRLSDIRRKTARLERLTDLATKGDATAQDKLVDDYMDLANYAIIAVAVLRRQE